VSFERPPVSTEIEPIAVGITRSFVDELDQNLETGRGLWFMGSTGTGKTSLSMLISSHALSKGYSVAIYTMPKLLARIRGTYERDAGDDSYLQFFDRLSQVDLLHIDDFGAEKRSAWVIEQLYSILNERYEQKRSIIATTNLDFDDTEVKAPGLYGQEPEMVSWLKRLEDEVGPRTVSRLIEICGDPVPMFGPDARVQARALSD
ncbi:MAG TPA: ATP-binding protein, partial [Solirubrobacterales bacterium]|nr:ATP-binding protein [Solirubrobacterales bacterium]